MSAADPQFVSKNLSESEKFWDKSAPKYAKSKISDEAAYQKKLAETQTFLKPDMNVVEFGCGTGSTAVHHAPHVHHIDAIDVSERMLEIGRERAREASVDNIHFTRGTLIDFNAADASVDAVLGLNIIHLIPDRTETLNEVSRILKPGGVFVSSTACLGNSLFRFIKLIAPLVRKVGLMPDVFVFTEQQLAAEITAAGFDVESQWNHGSGGISVFIIARKRAS